MIDVLIVEDQPAKANRVVKTISEAVIGSGPNIDIASNIHEATELILNKKYDLMILDVLLPLRDGEDARSDGAELLLNQLQKRHSLRIPEHIVGLTAFEDAEEEGRDLFKQFGWVLVKFDISSSYWSKIITEIVQRISKGKEVNSNVSFEVDIAFVTALEKPELEAVLDLQAGWSKVTVEQDDTIYYVGNIPKIDGSQLKVVAASAIQMGMPAAVGVAIKISQEFKPRYLVMTGICAGVSGNFGDIIVADKTWDYGSGKSKSSDESSESGKKIFESFEPAPTAIPLDPELIEKVKAFDRSSPVGSNIKHTWRGEDFPHEISVQIGPMASGAAVLENRPLIEMIKSHDRKLVAVEMEAYGIFLAARICKGPRPKAFVVKSICDLGDSEKNNNWQKLAAYTSAQFIWNFARENF